MKNHNVFVLLLIKKLDFDETEWSIINSWLIVMIIYLPRWLLLLVCNHPKSSHIDTVQVLTIIYVVLVFSSLFKRLYDNGDRGMGVCHGACWAMGRIKRIKNKSSTCAYRASLTHFLAIDRFYLKNLAHVQFPQNIDYLFILYVIWYCSESWPNQLELSNQETSLVWYTIHTALHLFISRVQRTNTNFFD